MVTNHKIIVSHGTGQSGYSYKNSVWMFSHDFQ